MTQLSDRLNDLFLTTNQDYGSFYSGRLQSSQIDRKQIENELSINDQIRHERRHLPNIAYDILFDVQRIFFACLNTSFVNLETASFIEVRRRMKREKKTTITIPFDIIEIFQNCVA